MILTLLQRLKPEVLEQLEISNTKYRSSVDSVKKVLESKYRYNELTMSEISALLLSTSKLSIAILAKALSLARSCIALHIFRVLSFNEKVIAELKIPYRSFK